MSGKVVTRFAPSPTGPLHLGGARTALYCWAYTRKHKGVFLLRSEDTDRQRSAKRHEDGIIAALQWLGIPPDKPLVRQSERTATYKAAVDRLLANGDAYRCYTTREELDRLREGQLRRAEKPRYDRRWRGRGDYPPKRLFTIRFATPLEGSVTVRDLVRGELSVANAELDDPVIMREDGTPTYNFACAVDDLAMEITHVIRGEDHITNTLRQVHIHAALGGVLPEFAHLPLILGPKLDEHGCQMRDAGGNPLFERMSKRNGAVDVDCYREQGFLAGAMANYIAQLGWTHPQDEVYGLASLAREFDISKVQKAGARFDLGRLRWINQQHMRAMAPSELMAMAGLEVPDRAAELAMEKARTLVEFCDELAYFHGPDEGGPLSKHLDESNCVAFAELTDALARLEPFEADGIRLAIRKLCTKHKFKFPRLGMPMRVCLTGREHSHDVAELAALLGRDVTLARMAKALPGLADMR